MQKLLERQKQIKAGNDVGVKKDDNLTIRKMEEREILSKQRFEMSNVATEKATADNSMAHLPHYCVMLQSNNETEVVEALTRVRLAVSSQKQLPLNVLQETGALDLVCNLYLNPNVSATVTCEAAWILTNVASGSSKYTQYIVKLGIVPRCIDIIKNADAVSMELLEQVIWLTANICGDNHFYTHMCVELGMIDALLKILNPLLISYKTTGTYPESVPPSLAPTAVFAATNLFRANPFPPLEQCGELIKVMIEISRCKDEEASEAMWALSHLSEHLEYLNFSLQHTLLDTLTQYVAKMRNGNPILMKSKSQHDTLLPVLRTAGQILSYKVEELPVLHEITDALIEAGIFDFLEKCIVSPRAPVVKEALWLLSNIAASEQKDKKTHVSALLRSNICFRVVMVLIESKKEVIRKEAAWVLLNVLVQKRAKVLQYLLDVNMAEAIVRLLEAPTLAHMGLDILNRTLTTARDTDFDASSYMSHVRIALEDVSEELLSPKDLKLYHTVRELFMHMFGEKDDLEEGQYGAQIEDENAMVEDEFLDDVNLGGGL